MLYPDIFSYHWIGMGAQILSLTFLSRRFLKRTYIELCSAFSDKLDTLNSKSLSNIARNHSGCPSVSLKYTKYRCTGMPKKLWVRHWGHWNYPLIGSSWVNHNKILNFHILVFLFFIWGGWHNGIAHNTELKGSEFKTHRWARPGWALGPNLIMNLQVTFRLDM